jgi:hypothetical protein
LENEGIKDGMDIQILYGNDRAVFWSFSRVAGRLLPEVIFYLIFEMRNGKVKVGDRDL